MGGERHAVGEVRRLAADDQGGGRVEQHDVAERALLAGQHVADRLGVELGVAALEVGQLGGRQAGVGRRHLEHGDLAVLQLGDVGRARRGDLVEAVVAVHHPDVLRAEVLQHVRDRLDPVPGEHADDLPLDAGRIADRSEQVEHGADARARRGSAPSASTRSGAAAPT